MEHPGDEVLKVCGYCGLRWEHQWLGLDLVVQSRDRLGNERHFPIDQREQSNSQGPDVGGL